MKRECYAKPHSAGTSDPASPVGERIIRVMEPSREFIEALDREEILEARAEPPGEKILGGPQLFDLVCIFAGAGIRHDFPGADDEAVMRILEQRLGLIERLENGA